MHDAPPQLRRSLGALPTTAQALATVGLTLTAVINIPAALAAGSGRATWLCYLIALLVIALVAIAAVLVAYLASPLPLRPPPLPAGPIR